MKVWELQDGPGIDNLRQVDRPSISPGAGQVLIAMRAASLNYRDLATIKGARGPANLPLIPFSDGAGEVVEVGAGVTRFRPGDRVCPMFFQSWASGPVSAEKRSQTLGGPLPGVLQEMVVLSEEGVSSFPQHLDFDEAATLPCAALTAWRAVAVEAPVGPGDVVLVQGTGGVSTFATQFAKARGARVIATSSSDAKLERVLALGADDIINYRTTPEWGKRALELTSGRGVDVVVEVGGENTFNQSLKAARVGGAVVVIGVLSGTAAPVMMPVLFSKNLRILGISVGSREHFADMCASIEKWKLRPVIDRIVGFDDVPEALRLMEGGLHSGKLVVRF